MSVTVTVSNARGPQGGFTGEAELVDFEVAAAPAYQEGRVFYDEATHSLSYYNEESDVTQNIGLESWVRVRNSSGATITNGTAVYISGATGQTPTIAKARADSATTSKLIGVATHDIENNSTGYVTTMGTVRGLDLSAFQDGDRLYLSAVTAGTYTTTAPTAPNRVVQIGIVEYAHATNGKLLVHPENDSVASTGIADSTATGRALLTATDAADARDTIGAQSTSVGFLNRFGRLANGTAVANGSTPEIGENVYIVWATGSANPTVVNEALEAAAGTLIYYGANVPTPNQRMSLTVWVEMRLNASYTSGTTAPDLTFGINATAWNSTLGLANFLNNPQCFHGQFRTNGVITADPFSEPPTIDGDDGSGNFSNPAVGVKFPIRIEIDGANDICRFTVAGRTRTYRDSRYSRMIGAESSGFFVEWGAPDSSTQFYWAIHSIIAQAPELEDSPTFDGGQYGRLIHEISTRGTTSLPGRYRILGGNTGFNANQAPGATDPFGIVGNAMLGHAPYSMPSPFLTSRISGIIQRNTVALASSAGASDQVLHTIARMESLASSTGAQFSAGAFFRTVYLGQFGANANNKRIKIVRSAGGATRFDSGVLTANAENFTLTHYEIRLAAGYIYITDLEWSDSAGLVKRIQTYNNGAGGADNQLLVTGTTAGDVTVYFHRTECHPVP